MGHLQHTLERKSKHSATQTRRDGLYTRYICGGVQLETSRHCGAGWSGFETSDRARFRREIVSKVIGGQESATSKCEDSLLGYGIAALSDDELASELKQLISDGAATVGGSAHDGAEELCELLSDDDGADSTTNPLRERPAKRPRPTSGGRPERSSLPPPLLPGAPPVGRLCPPGLARLGERLGGAGALDAWRAALDAVLSLPAAPGDGVSMTQQLRRGCQWPLLRRVVVCSAPAGRDGGACAGRAALLEHLRRLSGSVRQLCREGRSGGAAGALACAAAGLCGWKARRVQVRPGPAPSAPPQRAGSLLGFVVSAAQPCEEAAAAGGAEAGRAEDGVGAGPAAALPPGCEAETSAEEGLLWRAGEAGWFRAPAYAAWLGDALLGGDAPWAAWRSAMTLRELRAAAGAVTLLTPHCCSELLRAHARVLRRALAKLAGKSGGEEGGGGEVAAAADVLRTAMLGCSITAEEREEAQRADAGAKRPALRGHDGAATTAALPAALPAPPAEAEAGRGAAALRAASGMAAISQTLVGAWEHPGGGGPPSLSRRRRAPEGSSSSGGSGGST